MLFSNNTYVTQQKFGAIEGVKKLIEAGFPAIDMSFFNGSWFFIHEGDKIALAKEMRNIADDSGVILNKAHAPFGKPVIFEFCCKLLVFFFYVFHIFENGYAIFKAFVLNAVEIIISVKFFLES